MNASPLSASNPRESGAEAASDPRPATRAKRPLIYSLTGVCFLFGGLLAMQLRAIQQVHLNQIKKQEGIVEAQQLASKMKLQADLSAKERAKLNSQLVNLKNIIKQGTSLTASQVAALNSQIKDLQTVAGLTPVSGPGIRITASDNPKAGEFRASGTVDEGWGMVHDFDLQQVVNELRSAKADAIAIKGPGGRTFRITGYTPIRCVGPVIYINWEPVASPFTLEAVGDAQTMKSALEMPGGIIDAMRNNGPVGVKIETVRELRLPAATGGAPKLRVAKAIP
jgi:uncharacterized protein YlxW (UPF0749 family)